MGLFDKWIKKEPSSGNIQRRSVFQTDYSLDKGDWYEVFSACILQSLIVQENCADLVVRNRNWAVDFSAGTLSFGKDSYPVQLIGSESTISDTWMWGWNNINHLDENLIRLADEVHTIGEQWQLEPLTVEQFELDELYNGHTLAAVVCGITGNQYCYYKGPHANGAVLMAFSNVPQEVFASVGIHRFVSVLMDCIQNFDVDHKILVESFLIWNGTAYEWDGNTLIAHFETDLLITYEKADGFLRIAEIKSR